MALTPLLAQNVVYHSILGKDLLMGALEVWFNF